MDALLIMVLAFVGYILAYRLYGRYLGSKIFQLAADAKVPARELQDGVDFVPTKKEVIFGHHFTSIAGTGPIVGPAIAVIWGWLPALLWVIFGSIFMGGIHDFGALIVSARHQGGLRLTSTKLPPVHRSLRSPAAAPDTSLRSARVP